MWFEEKREHGSGRSLAGEIDIGKTWFAAHARVGPDQECGLASSMQSRSMLQKMGGETGLQQLETETAGKLNLNILLFTRYSHDLNWGAH